MASTFEYWLGDDPASMVRLDNVVVSDDGNYGINQVDIMNVNLLVEQDRLVWKTFLKDKWFRKVSESDGFIAFRGQVSEVRLTENSRFNLLVKIKAHTKVLSELTIDSYSSAQNYYLYTARSRFHIPDLKQGHLN